MKIIKEFEDINYPKRIYKGNYDIPFWFWGLGEDGELYYNRSDYNMNGWSLATNLHFPLSLSEMKKVIEEFGHLLVML
jgi:hypothetical protein